MLKMFIGLHIKFPLLWSDFNETWIFLEIFEKSTNIKFHENSSSDSRVVPCGRTDRRKDVTKLIVAFGDFANAPKKRKAGQRCYKFFLDVIHINLSSNVISVKCVLGFTRSW